MKMPSFCQLAFGSCLVFITACASADRSNTQTVAEPTDPDGLVAVEKAFQNTGAPSLKAQAERLVAAARNGKYFTSISGMQTLRRDPTLAVEQLTAVQDAVGKMQSRLAERVAQGQEALRHVNALQSETERLRE